MPVNMELCAVTGNDAKLLVIARLIEDRLGLRDSLYQQ